MLSVIVDDTRDPAYNLALDEALVRTAGPVPATLVPEQRAADWSESPAPLPALRVWQTTPSVTVGRFQQLSAAVDLAACARDGVRVLRRPTGGGAVFTDAGSLNITLVRRADGPVGSRAARRTDPRPGPRPDLDVLVATAVERFGLPAAALRDGVIQTAWLRTRYAILAHATVHVTPVSVQGTTYTEPHPYTEAQTEHHAEPQTDPRAEGRGGMGRTPPSLADHGLGITLDAVRAAVLSAVVDRYGIACARPPSPLEQRCRDHLLATRYNEVTWHLAGKASNPRLSMGFIGS